MNIRQIFRNADFLEGSSLGLRPHSSSELEQACNLDRSELETEGLQMAQARIDSGTTIYTTEELIPAQTTIYAGENRESKDC